MRETTKAPKEEPKKSSGLIFKVAIVTVILCIPGILAVVVFKLVLQPQMARDVTPEIARRVDDVIPLEAVTIPFDQTFATALQESSDVPASILMYQVSLECSNKETAALVTKHKSRFASMINDVHQFRSRAELDDRQVKLNMEKEIKVKANEILRRAQSEPKSANQILAVFHDVYTVKDI